MQRKTIGTVVLSLAIGFAVNVSAEISTATTDFSYTEAGNLIGTIVFDERPSKKCKLALRGVISRENESGQEAEKNIVTNAFITRRRPTYTFIVAGLKGIDVNEDGNRAVLTLQSRLKCPRAGTLFSNATAGYVACGRGDNSVTPSKFLIDLRSNIILNGVDFEAAKMSAVRSADTEAKMSYACFKK